LTRVGRLTVLSDYIAALDGYTVIAGGWINHHWIQLGYQLADSVAGGAYSFGMTIIILYCIKGLALAFPILRLRADDTAEIVGMDEAEIGEFAVSLVFRTQPDLTDLISMTTSRELEMSSP